MAQYPYIAIEGVIGVGKTTLARYLQQALAAELLLEVFEENPFLSDFYADRSRYAFQTQIFFLLSRYRQQHQVIPKAIQRAPLVTDYMFDKDRLFAHLNLANDELAVYEHTYAALAERIPVPQLVVYLRAGVDTLMERIAVRDRPYERGMNRDYIADLRRAYDNFFAGYTQSPTLSIDTDNRNIIHDEEARRTVIGQIKSAVTQGASQLRLPHLKDAAAPLSQGSPEAGSRRLPDFQRFHRALDAAKGFNPDLYLNYILLTEEIGELGREVARLWGTQNQLAAGNHSDELSRQQALAQHRQRLAEELADCMAYLLKLANYTGINLEEAYLKKMGGNINRVWSHRPGLAHLDNTTPSEEEA
jgi:deoxyadenosine/deoxycytidine kinase/NTP pyrophosphatase (non-canonical NTP hydrolase)